VIVIRSGAGLGDSLYLQAVVRHMLLTRDVGKIEARTYFPEVFLPFGNRVITSAFDRRGCSHIAHYSLRKKEVTDQFRDCCIQAGIRESVDLVLDWNPVNEELVRTLRRYAGAKPIIFVGLPRLPMDRSDGYGAELSPDFTVIQRIINEIKGEAVLVQVGKGKPLFEFAGLDFNLANETSVSEAIDVGYAADGFLGYVSFLVPLAESFSKPGLYVWARRGLASRTEYVRLITPDKVLHRRSSAAIFDDAAEAEIKYAARALLDAARNQTVFRGPVSGDRGKRALVPIQSGSVH